MAQKIKKRWIAPPLPAAPQHLSYFAKATERVSLITVTLI
jgi:hypothetical protein